jgi:hypothetical protein
MSIHQVDEYGSKLVIMVYYYDLLGAIQVCRPIVGLSGAMCDLLGFYKSGNREEIWPWAGMTLS